MYTEQAATGWTGTASIWEIESFSPLKESDVRRRKLLKMPDLREMYIESGKKWLKDSNLKKGEQNDEKSHEKKNRTAVSSRSLNVPILQVSDERPILVLSLLVL